MASVSHAAATAAPSRTSYRHLFAFLLLISLLPPSAYAGVSPDDRAALWELYQLTSGASWKRNENWSPDSDPCHFSGRWVGVGCIDPCMRFYDGGAACQLGRITSITLDFNDLAGDITNWHGVGNLTNLTLLEMTGNSIAGQLPTELGRIQNLEGLMMMSNNLGGTLPTELGAINSHGHVNLHEITLAFNSISGSIPTTIGVHAQLAALNLRDNQLVGELPTELAMLGRLEVLYAHNNAELGGTLPQQMGSLTTLRYLDLTRCAVSGTVPASIGGASLLQALHLEKNALSGSLPEELCHLRILRTLKLDSNRLEGSIPEGIGNLSSLVVLDLYNNSFIGDVPSSIRHLINLEELYLDKQHLLPLRRHYCGQRLPDMGKYSWRAIRDNYDLYMSSYCPEDRLHSTEYAFSTLQDSGVYEM